MRFQFDANQDYQLDAIAAVADLFDGQPRLAPGDSFGVVANRLDLDDSALLANLQSVQATNKIPADHSLATLAGVVPTADGDIPVSFPNFSVEMETGTGKTYVYIRTALDLHRRYGFRKFVIVVPSVAIREGVVKTFQITREHFAALYDNAAYSFYEYDSANLTRVRGFATLDSVEFMIMTIDSFNKASNVFRQSTDHLMGETPLHLVQATRPILILDEPQNMESEKSIAALAALHPLFALRYSATHRNPYNLVYRLTPADAYRGRLVKRIEVAEMVERDDTSQAYIRVEALESKKNTVTARLAIHQLMKDGTVKEKPVTVRPDDDLERIAGRSEYAGFVVEEINVGAGFVRFVNGVEVQPGIARGPDREALFRAQIRYTIEEHLRRQARLRARGIKVLTLFFIDRVDNYAPADGLLRRLFVEEFSRARSGYAAWRNVDADAVHRGYFAQRRTKVGMETIDSATGTSLADVETYNLIMKDKERLLSFDEPVAFIFSHSALREGWDNPNVFQICTLNQSISEVKKRQEVGRGMRLAVDQAGLRVRDETVNVLTVVANESYDRFVGQLQQETEDEFGREGTPPPPINAREREKYTARLVRERLTPEFEALWNVIRRKTRYSVHINTEALIADAAAAISAIVVKPPRITAVKASVDVDKSGAFVSTPLTGIQTVATLEGRAPLPNLLALIDNLMEHTTPPVHISRKTLLAILERAGNLTQAAINPQEYASRAARILKDQLADQLAAGIQYEPVEEWYEMTELKDEVASFKELVPSEKSVYDKIACDSDVERRFVADLDRHDAVRVYIKLPNWFTVTTPVGEYNPDWAIVMEDRDAHGDGNSALLYLVRETKSTLHLEELRADERRKLQCGAHHFRRLQEDPTSYQVVTSASQLPSDGFTPR